jgi:hypothetical protein
MSDQDIEYLLAAAVAEYRAQALPAIRPAGSAAVAARVRQRRRTQSALVAGVVAVGVVALLAGLAGVGSSGARPAPGSVPSGVSPTPSSSASPAGSDQPPLSPPPPSYDLGETTLSLPAWQDVPTGAGLTHCPAGTVTFHNDYEKSTGRIRLRSLTAVDVDRDGVSDLVAVFTCFYGQPSDYGGPYVEQAVAFRAVPGHPPTTIGVIVHSTPTDIQDIETVQPAEGGQVDIDVTDSNYGNHPEQYPLRQTRRYRYDGTVFRQTSGQPSFLVARDGPGVSLSGSRSPSGGAQQVTITVHNGGSHPVPVSVLALLPPATEQEVGEGWTNCRRRAEGGTVPATVICDFGYLAPGATVSYQLPIMVAKPPDSPAALRLRIGDQKYDDSTYQLA